MKSASAKPSQLSLSNLKTRIAESFNMADLDGLCFDLGIDFENLAGTTKESKTRELVLFFTRRNELNLLIAYLIRVRPNHNWEEIIGFSLTSSNSEGLEQSPLIKPTPINNTINIINTGGGSIIGGSVNTGGNFIGRDNASTTNNFPQPIVADHNSRRWIQLKDTLIAGKWKEADQETSKILLEICGRQKTGRMQAKDINKISCKDINTIDYLWNNYSNQQFGFSTQHNIWLSSGGQSGKFDFDVFSEFGERVGWRVGNTWLRFYEDFTFTLQAPKGHLPSLRMPGSENQAGTWQSWRDCFRDFIILIGTCISL